MSWGLMESNIHLFRLPANGPEWIAVAVGVLLGFIFSTSGWKGSQRSSELKNDPRVRSLTWAIGAGALAFLGSWKELLEDDHISRSAIGGFYIMSFILSVLIGVVIMTTIVVAGARKARKRDPNLWPERGFSPVLEFWAHGYQHYQDRLSDLMEKNRRDADAHALEELRSIVNNAAEGLAACILAVKKGEERLVIEYILRQMVAISRYYLQTNSHVNANWMLALHPHQLTASDRKEIRYTFDDENRYQYFLALKGYMTKSYAQSFLLPVERGDKAGMRKILPGAPEAFVRRQPVVVSVKSLDWARDVPEKIRQEVTEYFFTQPFKSFVSLVIPGEENTPLGIVNIESDNDEATQDKERMQQLIASLQPFLALLSLMIRLEGAQS